MFGGRLCENIQNKFLKLFSNKLNVPFTSDNLDTMRISELGFIPCEVKVADFMFIYDFSSGHISSPDLLSMLH